MYSVFFFYQDDNKKKAAGTRRLAIIQSFFSDTTDNRSHGIFLPIYLLKIVTQKISEWIISDMNGSCVT